MLDLTDVTNKYKVSLMLFAKDGGAGSGDSSGSDSGSGSGDSSSTSTSTSASTPSSGSGMSLSFTGGLNSFNGGKEGGFNDSGTNAGAAAVGGDIGSTAMGTGSGSASNAVSSQLSQNPVSMLANKMKEQALVNSMVANGGKEEGGWDLGGEFADAETAKNGWRASVNQAISDLGKFGQLAGGLLGAGGLASGAALYGTGLANTAATLGGTYGQGMLAGLLGLAGAGAGKAADEATKAGPAATTFTYNPAEAARANDTTKAGPATNTITNPSPATAEPTSGPVLGHNDYTPGSPATPDSSTTNNTNTGGGSNSGTTYRGGTVTDNGGSGTISGGLQGPARDTESIGLGVYNADRANYDQDDWNRGMEQQTSSLVSDEECKRFAIKAFHENSEPFKLVRTTIVRKC